MAANDTTVLPPVGMGNRLDDNYCWRCETLDLQLFHDPMTPAGDTIGVCLDCARQRFLVQCVYRSQGTNLIVNVKAG